MTRLLHTLLAAFLTVAASQAGVYFDLDYGDSRATVEKKLLANPRLESNVPETMLGRVGLNGTFKVKQNLSGQKFTLYFGWSDAGNLTEITLRSSPQDPSTYRSTTQSTFHAATALIQDFFGKPVMSNPMPPKKDLKEGSILNSHLWHVNGGSLLLGIARKDGQFHISIRFTQKKIQPVRTE